MNRSSLDNILLTEVDNKVIKKIIIKRNKLSHNKYQPVCNMFTKGYMYYHVRYNYIICLQYDN